MSDEMRETVTPAYTSWKTFLSFIDDCAENDIPGRVDASILQKMSGTAQNQLTAALRFMILISGDGVPLESLRELVEARKTEQWESVLTKVLTAAYEPVLGRDFDVKTATPAQIKERFRIGGGIEGETIDRAIRFYLGGLREAGIPFSGRLQLNERTPRNGAPRKIVKNARPERKREADGREYEPPSQELLPIALKVIGEEGSVNVSPAITVEKWKKIAQYVEMVISLRQPQEMED